MKRSDTALSIEAVLNLLIAIHELKGKYHLTDASFWDLAIIHFYSLQSSQGTSCYQISQMRQSKSSTLVAIKQRRVLLIKKGLIYVVKGRSFLTPLGYSELSPILTMSLKSIIKSMPTKIADQKHRAA